MTNTGGDLVLDGDVKCSLYCNIAQQLWKTTIQLHLSRANIYPLLHAIGDVLDYSNKLLTLVFLTDETNENDQVCG